MVEDLEQMCSGGGAGTSCDADEDCTVSLRCENAVCTSPSTADIARCQAAPSITIPGDGSEVVIQIPLDGDGGFSSRRSGQLCPPDGGRLSFAAEGFVQIQRTPTTDTERELLVRVDATPSFPESVVLGKLDCDDLYAPDPLLGAPCDTLDVLPQPFSVYFPSFEGSFRLLFAAPKSTAAGGMLTIHVQERELL